ncbi:hypothetical protein Taro_022252 [Colocasia esculenta]|uniref:Uncharacterized protein n=1 Tax=Colocasia esculenta TaxID=4460 RepID=A0A843V7D5_COLES|nr:hypothetical protein [Colocasia esculenta]
MYPPAAGSQEKYPSPLQVQAPARGPWSTGLCDCCDDPGNCCLTCWCPCVTFGRIAEITDRGGTCESLSLPNRSSLL